MRKLRDEKNTSIMMITHNLGVVAEICDTVYVMYAGQVVEHTDVYEIFKNPCHPYTEGLFNSLPDLEKDVERLTPIEGMPPDPTRLPEGCMFHPRCPYATEECKKGQIELFEAAPGHFSRCLKNDRKGER